VLHCVAVCCSLLQCVASVAHFPTVLKVSVAACYDVLQSVAACCSVLQLVALYCSVLQCVATVVTSLLLSTCVLVGRGIICVKGGAGL